MNEKHLPFEERRHHLAAEIARQRGDLAQAYHNLAKPIHYAEYGLRGFGFLRKNPWVLTVVPAVFSISSTVIGLIRGQQPAKSKLTRGSQRQRLDREIEKEKPRGIFGHALHYGAHGVRLFKLYRRFRRYLPLP
jgi:hypothetical protein